MSKFTRKLQPAQSIKASDLDLEFVKLEGSIPRKNASLLFVPGLYHGAWAFRDGLMPFFAKQGYDVYTYSPRGHGTSDGREILAQAGFDDYLADLRQIVKRIEGPVILIGHSMGGMLVEKHLESETAKAAVLLCAPTSQDLKVTGPVVLKNFFWPTLKFALTGNPDHLYHDRAACRGLLFSGDTTAATENALTRICNQPQSRQVMKDLMIFEPGPTLQKIPVLLIGAEGDISIPKESLIKRAQQKEYEIKIYPGRSHEIFVTAGWEDVAKDVLNWLEQAEISAA